jgi:subtilisin family serine protease
VADFDERTLRLAHPSLRLLFIDEHPSVNARSIVVAVPDPELAQVIAALMALPGVQSAAPYVIAQAQGFLPNDPRWPEQSDLGMHLFELPKAWWLVGNGSPTVRVAIVDSGINPIPELSGKIEPGYSTLGPEDSYDTTDNHGHGTMVASIIAAHKDNNHGIAGAANVQVVPVRACDLWVAGSLRCEPSDVLEAVEWVFDNRANIDVANISLGPVPYSQAMDDFLELIDEWGIITVASAGNTGGNVIYPASSEYVIAVSGTDTFACHTCRNRLVDFLQAA